MTSSEIDSSENDSSENQRITIIELNLIFKMKNQGISTISLGLISMIATFAQKSELKTAEKAIKIQGEFCISIDVAVTFAVDAMVANYGF